MNGDIVWQPAMVKCVCGHFHADSCPCGCSFAEPDDGSEGGPTNARYTPYSGVYRGPYNLDQETA